ncbi:MAG: DNA double-strand break repair nuclease NurA [Tissierellia bacterium]|nr:DNA double-strand break repair nuclease NurA [Tissierellia bacterium]
MNDLYEIADQMNEALKEYYRPVDLSKEQIRHLILSFGKIGHVEKAPSKALQSIIKGGKIMAVDGSNNSYGGLYPHYIEIYRGVAISSMDKKDDIVKSSYFCPLLSGDEGEKGRDRERRLAQIELEVALTAIEHSPSVLIMDGSLIRYHIFQEELYKELTKCCIDQGIILVGVIEDLKTSILYDLIHNKKGPIFYDREGFYNNLEIGEFVVFDPGKTKKEESGIYPTFLRSSKDPYVIGVDFLQEQKGFFEEILSLLYTLTPEGSRGIPQLLDIADQHCKITDKAVEEVLRHSIDPIIFEKILRPQRNKRSR